MNDIIWLTMRRMRTPLILLILVYSLSVSGLAMIPGEDEFGNAVRITFLDALYFVAILATTSALIAASGMRSRMRSMMMIWPWRYSPTTMWKLLEPRSTPAMTSGS